MHSQMSPFQLMTTTVLSVRLSWGQGRGVAAVLSNLNFYRLPTTNVYFLLHILSVSPVVTIHTDIALGAKWTEQPLAASVLVL